MNPALLDVAIRETREKICQSQSRHRLEQAFDRAVLAKYGGKFRSGKLLYDERKILREISALGATLKILLAVRDHGVDLHKKKGEAERSVASVNLELQHLEKRLEELRLKKTRKEAKLARIDKALSLLS